MKFFSHLLLYLCFLPLALLAQNNGSLSGQIRSASSQGLLENAKIEILNISPTRTEQSDAQGNFTFQELPLGRYRLLVSKEGYESTMIPDIIISSAQVAELSIELDNALVVAENKPDENAPVETKIKVKSTKDKPYNALSALATRPFTIEEVIRYAGARFDPALLITNFAGVSSYDDSRNDIVVRGNPPMGLAWQIEELPIENPNHLVTIGSRAGGIVPMLNIYAMGRADFAKGSFSAQYGNTITGVFDIQLREGNKNRLGGLAQIGSQRAEFLLEGPFAKNNPNGASFLVSARGSIGNFLFSKFIPTDPEHQDLNFKLNLGNQTWGQLEIFGIAGHSHIFLPYTADNIVNKIRYQIFEGESFEHRNFMGLLGAKYTLSLNQNSFWRTIVGAYYHANDTEWLYHDETNPQDIRQSLSYLMDDQRLDNLLHSYYQGQVNRRLLLRAGLQANFQRLNYLEYATYLPQEDTKFQGWHYNFQPYAQARYALSQQWQVYGGLRMMYHSLAAKPLSLDPRLAFLWTAPSGKHTFGLGYAMMHQAPEIEIRYYNPIVGYADNGDPIYDHQNGRALNSLRSQQLDLEYNWLPAEDWRVKIGAYGQMLDKVWIEQDSSSLYSYLNTEGTFFAVYYNQLNNQGKGRNYGLELTVEKFFSKGYYALLAASAFDSKFLGGDGVWRNSVYNNRYIVNLLLGKEFRFGQAKQHLFFTDVRFSTKGGRPYRPIDAAATHLYGFQNGYLEPVYRNEESYLVFTPAFYQVDLKFGCRLNSLQRRMTHTIRVDLFNAFNIRNVFTYQYSEVYNQAGQREPGQVFPVYQRGFIPDITYSIQF